MQTSSAVLLRHMNDKGAQILPVTVIMLREMISCTSQDPMHLLPHYAARHAKQAEWTLPSAGHTTCKAHVSCTVRQGDASWASLAATCWTRNTRRAARAHTSASRSTLADGFGSTTGSLQTAHGEPASELLDGVVAVQLADETAAMTMLPACPQVAAMGNDTRAVWFPHHGESHCHLLPSAT